MEMISTGGCCHETLSLDRIALFRNIIDPDRMPERMSEYMSDRLPEFMSNRIPNRMSE